MTKELPYIVDKKELLEMIPYTAQHVLRLEKQGKFPKRIRLGDRRVGWRLSEIEAWLEARAAAKEENSCPPWLRS